MKKANCILFEEKRDNFSIRCNGSDGCDFATGMICEHLTLPLGDCISRNAQCEFVSRISAWSNRRMCALAHAAAREKESERIKGYREELEGKGLL